MRHQLLFLATLSIATTLTAQITFEHTYGGPEGDMGSSVEQTQDGGYALFGATWNTDGAGPDMYLVKTDANGVQQWDNTYGNINANMGYGAKQTSDGGFILCGMFGGFGTDTLTLVRTDASGNELWTRGYPGVLGRDIGYSVLQTSDGGFAVCGFVEGYDGTEDVFVVRTDADGDTVWTSAVDLGGSEAGWCIRATADDGFIVVANSFIFADPDGENHLLRFDANGDTLWTRTYAAPGPDESHGLAIASEGGFIIAGGNGYPSRDILLIRTDPSGNELWRRTHATTGDEMALDVQQLEDGGFICAGRKEDLQTGDIQMHLLRTDADGYFAWERTFQEGIFSDATSLDLTSDGGFVLLGTTIDTLSQNANSDMYLVKTDGAGYSAVATNPGLPAVLVVFPNPAADFVRIVTLDEHLTSVLITDASGRPALATAGASADSQVDVRMLPSGTYFVTATLQDGRSLRQGLIVAH